MRFLVIAEMPEVMGMAQMGGPNGPEQMAPFLERIVKPSLQTMEQWERDGKGKGGIFPGQRKHVMIMDAASAEELDQMLSSLPLWPMDRWEVHSLMPMSAGVSRVQNMLGHLRESLHH